MPSSGSSLLPFDPEIERIARAIRKETREASLDERGSLILSSDSEEEDNMVAPTPLTMGDYYK